MSKKDIFISEIESANITFSEDAAIYFEALKNSTEKETKRFTENGLLVLGYMRDHKDEYNNIFTAKSVGEGLGITSRTASGAARKLVTDGFIEKMGTSPVSYSLTKKGIEVDLSVE